MKKELELQLVRRFPDFFKEYGGDKAETCMHWGCSHGDGWFGVLWSLCMSIEGHYKGLKMLGKRLPPKVVFEQVKEKYGSLTVYFRGGDKAVRNFVDFASVMSTHTCELCGSTTDVMRSVTVWSSTICSACVMKDEYGRYKERRWVPACKIFEEKSEEDVKT
jgi:ribosomal protein L37AE/L43A